MRLYTSAILSAVMFSAIAASCDSDSGGSTGKVQVFIEPEDTIPDGLEPGTGLEQIVDGWTVKYTTFVVGIGNFRAQRGTNASTAIGDGKNYVVDLMATPAGGLVILEEDNVEAARFDKVGYDIANAKSTFVKATGTSQAAYDEMVAGGYSLHVAGTMTKPGGQSCKPDAPTDCVAAESVDFDWAVKAGTSFDDCAPEGGAPGFAVPSGGTVQVKPTIHGDHWFFSNITQGVEITERRAQWIANADLDRDGLTTLEELGQTKASDLFPAAQYNLSGAIIPINNGRDYLVAQMHTLGDFQGEGECPTRVILP